MRIEREQCAQLIKENDSFLVLAHEHPDGDTLGAAFALCEMLRRLGKKRAFSCCDEVTSDFYYITDGFENDDVTSPYIIAVDVADARLLGSLNEKYGDKVDLCIDHHMSNTLYAAKTLVEERAAASEIIYELLPLLGLQTDKYIADCLYTGISTDTGCFRYQNTTASTFAIASELARCGAEMKLINKLMFETKSKRFLALELMARQTLEYHFDDKLAIITITNEMYEKSGSNEHECYPITALPREIEGVLVGAVIKEKEDGSYGISVRTEGDIDASDICARLGGGGHKGAAGCKLREPYDKVKSELLASVKISLDGLKI